MLITGLNKAQNQEQDGGAIHLQMKTISQQKKILLFQAEM